MTMGQHISGKRAQQLVNKGAVLVDVRGPVAFRDGSLPGAINMSLRQISQVQKYPKTTPIVVYGESSDPSTLTAALNYISVYGFNKVYSLGTMENWHK